MLSVASMACGRRNMHMYINHLRSGASTINGDLEPAQSHSSSPHVHHLQPAKLCTTVRSRQQLLNIADDITRIVSETRYYTRIPVKRVCSTR